MGRGALPDPVVAVMELAGAVSNAPVLTQLDSARACLTRAALVKCAIERRHDDDNYGFG
ncbi:hypothetical protein PCAR4_140044 [Paraburkholderia caribensis]|nr:hypothetical protein PCAR4_140044 [Paraburkholderia caribensis]